MKLFLNKLTALTLFTALLFAGCKRELTEGIDTVINTNVYIAPTVISFVNANETSPVQPKDFTVTITGKDAAKVVMQSGGTNFKVVGGMLQLALLSTAIPTATSPITFNVNVAVDSFAPTSQTIIISDTISTVETIKLVDYYNPVAGTAAIVATGSLNNGASPSVQTIATATNSTTTETTKITIPAGTIMQDANGNTINASSLTSQVIYFSPNTPDALSAFPGGLSPKDVIGANGQPIDGGVDFVTAGLASIKMKAGNTEVKKFNTPISVEMQINSAFENPETGTAIKAGDKIPVWSMEEATGQWKYESEATVTSIGGKLAVQFPASHLSIYNLDYIFNRLWPRCTNRYASLSVLVTTSDRSSIQSGNYDILLCTPGYSPRIINGRPYYDYFGSFSSRGIYTSLASYTTISNNRRFTTYGIVAAQTAQILIVNSQTGAVVSRSSNISTCTNGIITLNVARTLPKIFTVNLLAYGKCSNKNALSYFNGWLYFQKAGSYYGQWVYAYNGRAYFQLEDGADYYIYGVDYTTYRSASSYGRVSSSIVGNFTVNGLTCTGSYNAANSIYNLTITQNVFCK